MILKRFFLFALVCFIFQSSNAMDNQPSDSFLYRAMSDLYKRSKEDRKILLQGYHSHTQPKENTSTSTPVQQKPASVLQK